MYIDEFILQKFINVHRRNILHSKQIKEKMIEVDAFGNPSIFVFWTKYHQLLVEMYRQILKGDDEIKAQEVVEELRVKKAEMQVLIQFFEN